jgi:hypothetical protein
MPSGSGLIRSRYEAKAARILDGVGNLKDLSLHESTITKSQQASHD